MLSLLHLIHPRSSCLEMNAPNQPSIEYMKQLLLSSLRKSIDENLKSSQRGEVLIMYFRLDATPLRSSEFQKRYFEIDTLTVSRYGDILESSEE